MSNSKSALTAPSTQRVYAKKSAEVRMLERKNRLLDAALELFAQHGYANTTIEALCTEAKVTTRNFYQAFTGREALLLALYNQMMQELNTVLLSAIQAEPLALQEKMKQVVHALVYFYFTDPRRAKVGVLEVVGASPAIEQRRREVIHHIAAHLELYLKNTTQQYAVQHNYHWLAIALVGGINELMADWLMSQCVDLEKLNEEILQTVEILLRGIFCQHLHMQI